MGRIMAVDYGQKRTGLAVTDMLKMIANRLTVVSSREATGYIARYVSQEPVDLIVVGYSKQMNNEPSENMKRVEAFVAQLTKTLPSIPVEYYDERFTVFFGAYGDKQAGFFTYNPTDSEAKHVYTTTDNPIDLYIFK